MHVEPLASPAREPITLAEVKAHLRITEPSEDAYLAALMESARRALEQQYGLALITQQVAVLLDDWPSSRDAHWWNGLRQGPLSRLTRPHDALVLPIRPVRALLAIDIWQDGEFREQSADGSYIQPGLTPRFYPATALASQRPGRKADGIRLSLEVGFGDDWNAVPAAVQMALLRLVGHLYSHRGDAPVAALSASGARQLMAPYREVRL